jgi:serine/threonine protein kinase
MSADTTERYQQLLDTPADDETFVRQTFRLMEADLRTLALSALADWANADLSATADILFQAVGTLQRPAWGSWNGLLEALIKARRKIAREGDAASRKALEQAATVHSILTALERKLTSAQLGDLKPLIELTRHQGGLTLQQLLILPIRLRNRAAHDNWSDPRLWTEAAGALRPLVCLLAEDRPFAALTAASLNPEPFFLSRDGQWWAFNGIAETGAVFTSPDGASMESREGLAEVLLLFQRVLGRTAEQEEGFRRWLGRLAPEDVKGVLLGDFLVGRPVGRGGFATVHKGVQLSTGRQVAVKVLNDGLPEDAKLRFQQEAAFLARCDHPHVVGVIGYGEAPWSAPRAYSLDGEPWYAEFARSSQIKTFIALEWIDGHTLDDYIKGAAEPAPDLSKRLEWFLGAAQALVNVHANGLIHRDVKPSNLMVTEAGLIKLMDFGIARTQAEDRTIMTATGQGLGTPAYMAPEQIRAEDAALEVGPAADIYGLCATFYEVFTGTRLFHHDRETAETVKTSKLAGQLPPAPRAVAPELEWELETILVGGLQNEVADRYRSAEALARDLNHVRNDEPIEYRRPSLARRVRLTYRRNRRVFNTAGVFCALIVLLTAWYLFNIIHERDRAEQSAQAEQRARLDAQKNLRLMRPSV